MLRLGSATDPPGYAWMLDLLYGGRQSVTWAAAGCLPDGYARADQLVRLPSAPGRSFLVSLASRRGTSSALTSYNALRSGRRKIARQVLGSALHTGMAQPVLRSRVDIGIRVGTSADQRADDLLDDQVRALCASSLPATRLVTAISGGQGPYRKPVLHVFSQTGKPLGFIKVGWNTWTKEGVRQEKAALNAHGALPRGFGVPNLLTLSDWHGLNLLVTAPLPERVTRIGASAGMPDASVLREINGLSEVAARPLAESVWWLKVRARIRDVVDRAARQALTQAAEQINTAYGRATLDFGFCHGDFTPWNLGQASGRLYVWDWESSVPDAPVGFDAVHYLFQVGFVGRQLPLEQAAVAAARSAPPVLLELGVPARYCGLVTVLHLVELFLRHEAARASAGAPDERFYPSIGKVLERQLTHICPEAAPHVEGGS
jgi:hypothetical protein